MSEEIAEEMNRFFNVDEEDLRHRVSIIRAELRATIDNLRKEIPEETPDEELFENKSFIRWKYKLPYQLPLFTYPYKRISSSSS